MRQSVRKRLNEPCGTDDWDIAKRMQFQQIGIARNQPLRTSVNRWLQKLIAARISALRDSFANFDFLSPSEEACQAVSKDWIGHCGDPRSGQDLAQLALGQSVERSRPVPHRSAGRCRRR
jgi:hypothetical protein